MKTNTNTTKIKDYNTKRQNTQLPTDSVSKTPAEKIQADTLKRRQETETIVADLKAEGDQKETDKDKLKVDDDENEDDDAEGVNDSIKLLTDSMSHLIDQVNARVNPVKSWIASQPTPGGIAALILFIAFMMLAIIPVNAQGQTRLYLFYNTLVGRTHMLYRENMSVGKSNTSNVVSGGVGAEGNSSANGSTNGTISTGQPIDLSLLNLFGTSGD
jgi:hypothetical protein